MGEVTRGEAALGDGALGEEALGEGGLGEATLGGTTGGVFGSSGGVGGLTTSCCCCCCSLSKSPNIFSMLLGSLKRGMKELVSPCFSFPRPFFFSFVFLLSESCYIIKNDQIYQSSEWKQVRIGSRTCCNFKGRVMRTLTSK